MRGFFLIFVLWAYFWLLITSSPFPPVATTWPVAHEEMSIYRRFIFYCRLINLWMCIGLLLETIRRGVDLPTLVILGSIAPLLILASYWSLGWIFNSI